MQDFGRSESSVILFALVCPRRQCCLVHVLDRNLECLSATVRHPAALNERIRDPVRIEEGKLWSYPFFGLVVRERWVLSVRRTRIWVYAKNEYDKGPTVGQGTSPWVMNKPPKSAASLSVFVPENNWGGRKSAMV